ncbi:hypothetical protein G7072_13365 [Nocardioides sp. HDW12B]|uniref:hypothetical protein n=1 Tax=Nocardioides sp. HDW12B TaxID=2714939 RepID=UPI001409296B|nr:hypothetical protein [Nocardioides sp. HDW12B]QIK67201.1 hypothetical protein G7072_13365 [Nocardioides sp. HDW12B]
MTVMEKLLVPATTARIVERGHDEIGGPVHRAADLSGLGAQERVAAHGLAGTSGPFGDDPAFVDVLRFPTWPTVQLLTPTSPSTPGERPWPVFVHGFLLNAVPVWTLTATRVPTGSRVVRIGRDGRETELSSYGGAGWGWQRAKGYTPPLGLLGPRAQWQGQELPGSYSEDQRSFELVRAGVAEAPPGFRESRPRVFVREVPLSECDAVFEVVLTARWRGVDVRVVRSTGRELLLQLTDPTLAAIAETGASPLDPWTFQVVAPSEEVTDVFGIRNEAAPD